MVPLFGRSAIRVTVLSVLLLMSSCYGTITDSGPPASGPSATPVSGLDDSTQADTWHELSEQGLEPFVDAYRVRFGEDPPTAELVRYIDPLEYAEVQAQCMRDEGWPARETKDGGVVYDRIPDEQGQAQQNSWFRCMRMYPVHPTYTAPLDERQVRVMYDHYVDTVVPCFAAEGHVMEAPSWETFHATWDTPEGWTPHGELILHVSPREWERVNETCPQIPPFESMFPQD